MRALAGLLILFLSATVWGQAPKGIPVKVTAPASVLQFFVYNPELRYERGNSQELVDRRPLNLAMAYQYKKASGLLEYSRFTENSGNATSSIERSHQDLSLWFRHHFFETRSQSMTFSLFGGAGAGVYDEEVKTTLMGLSRSDRSAAKMMAGLTAGGDWTVTLRHQFDFVTSVEGRALLASDFDPNPVWSAVMRLGFSWHF